LKVEIGAVQVSIQGVLKRRINKRRNKLPNLISQGEGTMKYLLLIYSDEKADVNASPEEQDAWMNEYFTYTEEMRKAGISKDGEALQPTATATTVRVRDGKSLTTHGPFAETKEQLGGFYLLDCKNLDEAIEWASKCPGARVGSIELRPIMEFG
jgi:hypothetical protein